MFCFCVQAEDGIRDIGVTGVQTCALPIFSSTRGSPATFRTPYSGLMELRKPDAAARVSSATNRATSGFGPVAVTRSGERRVGQEGRYRWTPYHLKKIDMRSPVCSCANTSR